MSKQSKLRKKILSGNAVNIAFSDLCTFLQQTGFILRQKGSHRIFHRDGIVEIIDLQSKSDGKAKAYQVRQVRDIVERYQL
jgi:predicted RNA binding protein YcfA (HicA-like mRNA interferase family)